MTQKPFFFVALFTAILLAIGVGPGFAQDSAPQTDGTEMSEEEKIAEALANPLSYLWLLFVQNDTLSYDGDVLEALGEDAQTQNTTILQPVLSMQLTEKWKTIFRPVITFNSFKVVDNVNISTDGPQKKLFLLKVQLMV